MRYVEVLQYQHPKESILYISLLDDEDAVKEASNLVINTKNFELLLETGDFAQAQYGLTLISFFGEKVFVQICRSVAEHLEKTNDSPEIAMQLYDRIGMQKEVISMWIKEQVQMLENVNPLGFPVEGPNYPASESLKTVQQRYGSLYEGYAKSGVFERFPSKMRTLARLEKCCMFYSLVFQAKHEDALSVCLKWIYNK